MSSSVKRAGSRYMAWFTTRGRSLSWMTDEWRANKMALTTLNGDAVGICPRMCNILWVPINRQPSFLRGQAEMNQTSTCVQISGGKPGLRVNREYEKHMKACHAAPTITPSVPGIISAGLHLAGWHA